MSYRWLEIDANGNVYSGDKIFLKSTSSFTVTLPASPLTGVPISFIDGAGLCNINNITIARNGKKIAGIEEDLTITENNASFDLVYQGSDYGWVIR